MNSFVAFHRFGIVFGYSYNDTTNPKPVDVGYQCRGHHLNGPVHSVPCSAIPRTIFLIVVLHEHERVEVNVARVFDVRLNPPKVIILPQGFVMNEQPGLVSISNSCPAFNIASPGSEPLNQQRP